MTLRTIAVIGADSTGAAIASLAASAGYKTVLEDVSEERLHTAMASIVHNLGEAASSGNAPDSSALVSATSNLSIAATVEEAIREADLIIDTLADEEEMKLELFTIFDKFSRPHAILASTGFLPIGDLASITFCADRCIGMRFGQDIAASTTVDLIPGPKTSRETISACSEAMHCMGKEVRILDDSNREDPLPPPARKGANG